MSEARAKMTVADGTTIEFEGTEAFVTAQLEKFAESIDAGLAGKNRNVVAKARTAEANAKKAAEAAAAAAEAKATAAAKAAATAAVEAAATAAAEAAAAAAAAAAKNARDSELARVFAPTDRGVQILVDIPGDTRGQKMVNAARLLLYGAAALKNRRSVFLTEVGAVCKAHRCLDSKNLASTLKHHNSSFVFAGRRKQLSVALTESGTKAVEAMLKTLSPAAIP